MKPFLFALIVTLCLIGCQKSAESPTLPTLVRLPTLTATFHPSESPTATLTPTPSPTISPTATFTMTPSPSISPTFTDTPTATLTYTPSFTATPLPEAFIFGRSAGERDLIAYRFGTGSKIIMLIGGIHAGFEVNTSQLMEELRSHFASNPNLIQEGITLLIIPALNPDGASVGRTLQGRFNGNNVDLNRNWGCGWKEDAFFRDMEVDAGEQAFSEPETRALGSLIQRTLPSAVMFYHAAANGVFAGACDESHNVSSDLAALYGQASGYPYGSDFSAYAVTGTAPAWVDSLGIPALDVELATADTTEFNRNLQAILAVQSWVLAR